MRPLTLPTLLLPLLLTTITTTTTTTAHPSGVPPRPLPLLIWHGLGDMYNADGLQSVGDLAKEIHPGTFVYYIRLDDDGGSDRSATFFGNVTEQIEQVCGVVTKDPRLFRRRLRNEEEKDEDGAGDEEKSVVRVDALGFSQGGQLLRGLLQRCEGLEIRSLVTFGSQHNGIAEFQTCGDWDFLCKAANGLIKGNAWTDYVQGKVVPAQYYRQVDEETGLGSEEYLHASNFLADVNNERELKNEVYKKRIAALEKFVMFVFEDDQTVIPKESGWFAEVNRTSSVVTPLRERSLYQEDWLGLKALDEKDGLVFRSTKGGHMQLGDKVLRSTFRQYFGPETEEKPGLVKQVDDDDPKHASTMEMIDEEEPTFLLEWSGTDWLQKQWNGMWFWQRWRWRWDYVYLQDWYGPKVSL